ncbi:MAG TPA: acyl-CoA reductase [Polyangiales bacterium]|nr:acyl-CoA reductase [Polyangiales bacterium]
MTVQSIFRSESLTRNVDLALHRVRVGHGIPESAAPLTRLIERITRDGFEEREQKRVRAEADAVKARYRGHPISTCVSRLPNGSGAAAPVAIRATALLGGVECNAVPCTPELLTEMTTRMRERGVQALRKIPIRRILDILDRASRLWLDPEYPKRALAIEAIHRWTGFSREMVIHSIDLEMRSSRKLDLWRTLWTELGNPKVLDDRSWVPSGEAPARAFGPGLVGAVFSSNIPALPHLTYMRGLAVKSPVIGKVASNEPIFAALYVDTLLELCEELEPAIAAVWYPGGTEALEAAMLAQSDFVIAYGSDSALAGLARSIPPESRRLLHGHRMGIGALDRKALRDPQLASQMAYDFAVFDGQACLAPVVYFVEADEQTAVTLAEAIGRGLDRHAEWLRPRTVRPEDRAARQHTVQRWEIEQLFGDAPSRVVHSEQSGLPWAGLITRGKYTPQALGDRLFHLHCIDSIDEVIEHVRPYARYLQNAALALAAPAHDRLSAALAGLGVSRVNRPGRMATPSMMWHHDGRACLAELVRWSDIA